MSRIDETLELIDEALESYETQTDEIARRAWAIFDDTSQPEGVSWRIESDIDDWSSSGVDWTTLIERVPVQRGAIEYYTEYYGLQYLVGEFVEVEVDWRAVAAALEIPEEMLLPETGVHWAEVSPVRWFTPLDEDGNPITPS